MDGVWAGAGSTACSPKGRDPDRSLFFTLVCFGQVTQRGAGTAVADSSTRLMSGRILSKEGMRRRHFLPPLPLMTSRFALARSSVACAQSYEQGLAQVGAPPQFVFDCGHNATDQERRTPEGKLSNGGKASGSLINVHADAWKVVFPCQVARDCVPCAYTTSSRSQPCTIAEYCSLRQITLTIDHTGLSLSAPCFWQAVVLTSLLEVYVGGFQGSAAANDVITEP
ncbi:hypothetical protein I7I51_07165 [Histoplasma capsulatum]|uniref:Uncharacterized protein n=1 Tax=Ajellomyces capsulatus TaxID=5037 RepID=A0A8A1MI54_AJECA|nr:hypothetical protein I7I51_07165 [Histoplasma capsulatum]